MKRIILLLLAGIAVMLTACQEDDEQVMPEDRLQEYVEYWNEQDFDSMHEMVEIAEEEQFDRYEKIYGRRT